MKSFITSHSPIFLTIMFGLYSQIVMKWQMQDVSDLPSDVPQKVVFLIKLLFTPWILSAAFATFLGGLTWMTAMHRFDLGYAYLYISLLFVLTMIASVLIFQEPLNLSKLLGASFILVGIIFLGYGQQV